MLPLFKPSHNNSGKILHENFIRIEPEKGINSRMCLSQSNLFICYWILVTSRLSKSSFWSLMKVYVRKCVTNDKERTAKRDVNMKGWYEDFGLIACDRVWHENSIYHLTWKREIIFLYTCDKGILRKFWIFNEFWERWKQEIVFGRISLSLGCWL